MRNSALLVIGHRGASGYRPENTLEAFELAFAQGADAIELDLVPTSDGQLIIRHEPALDETTNIASLPQFANRRSLFEFDDQQYHDWFSHDLTAAEVSELRARERIADQRPGSAKFDGQFAVPTLDAFLAAPFINGKIVILEIKHGAEYAAAMIPMVSLLARILGESDWQQRGVKVVVESFDLKTLLQAKRVLGDVAEYFFLLEPRQISGDDLSLWSQNFEGISVHTSMVLGTAETYVNGVRLVDAAHAAGLQIYTYTARVEEAENSFEEYYANLIYSGVDGIFADQPDLLHEVVSGLA
ncbi:MAG: hypothetical protein RLZZ359_616 [Actinomycetota bacterium]|jgi:glycerophosphoryl diester phosphodiesterase